MSRRTVDPPADLKPAARARWQAVYPALRKRGAVDLEQLRWYCQTWARWREAEDSLDKAGTLTKAPNGRIVPSPLVALAKQTGDQVRELEQRLGLGPEAAPGGGTGHAGLVTRRVLADRLGVHPMTVVKWEQDGAPVAQRGARGRASLYDPAAVVAWKAARDKAATERPEGHVDVAAERARKERAQAVLAEQTFAARARRLLPIDEVERVWAGEVAAVRSAILATYTTAADRLHRVAVTEGVAGVEAELRDLAYGLLRELADPTRPLPGGAPVAEVAHV